MRVEKLEINGFKSFGDRTVLSLHPGITAIVGPNGCGKSNVVDSFKWVLGEQSAKSLRGGKMDEVIFVGSQNKKPKGMAEVSLTLRGIGATDDGKENSTVVTRRLYRSGESDYMINRQSCRLRDIRDLFMDTGLDIKSYSILEQDRISAILAAKPEDRRFIIEEIAGVVKYKLRRGEAQNKLESSRANILRINDIVSEIKRQINSLDRQVKKAERYKRLMAELRTVELRLSRYELKELDNLLRNVTETLEAQREQDAVMRAELSEAEAGIETRRIELAERERALQGVLGELQSVQRTMAEHETALAVTNSERESLKEYVIKLGVQAEENVERRRATLGRREEIGTQRETLKDDIVAQERSYEDHALQLQGIEEEITGEEQNMDSMRREAFGATEALSRLRTEHERFRSVIENLGARESALHAEIKELTARHESLEAERREIEAGSQSRRNEMFAAQEEKRRISEEIGTIRVRLDEGRSASARAREELASTTSRLESLREMVIDESGEASLRERVSVLATIADAVEAPAEYEGAIEGALREIISGFILETPEDIRQAVGRVREMGMGRTAFVARSMPALTDPWATEPMPEGIMARASAILRGNEEFLPIVRGLLRDVFIVRDLDSALGMSSLSSRGMTLVTIDGEIVQPNGAVIAGKSRGILTIKRQIRELAVEAERIRHTIEVLVREIAETEVMLEARQSSLRIAEEKAVEMEKELSILRHRADTCNEDIDRALRKMAHLRLEVDELLKEKDQLMAQMTGKIEEIERGDERRRQIEGLINEAQAKLAEVKALSSRKRDENVEIRLALNTLRERATSLQTEQGSVERLIVEIDEKQGMIAREAETTKQRIEERNGQIAEKEEVIAGFAVSATELTSRLNSARELMNQMASDVSEVERGLRTVRTSIDESTQRIAGLEINRAECTMKTETLMEKMREVYGVDLWDLTFEVPHEGDAGIVADVKQKIEALGPVSLGSLDEYEELRQRYEFLTQQQEDLQKSIAELEEAISRINTTTRKLLRDAYEAIKVKFAEVYVMLFGGGRAELVLTDPDNILETGIDIIAQPPGKRLQNISLLSGGEKTLTALALLFASFLIKPTPLCILDEADAALDEHNTYKFAQMLKELASSIQFIVVTHNRVTMEAANYIYGVTMEEPGSSKAISMQMAESAPVTPAPVVEEETATDEAALDGLAELETPSGDEAIEDEIAEPEATPSSDEETPAAV